MEASRSELLRIIAKRDERIADLEALINDLTNIIQNALSVLTSAITLRELEPGEDIKLADLNLTTRAFNACQHMDIKTARDLTRYTKKELLKFRNLGLYSLRQVEKALAEHGLELKPEI